MLATLTPEPRPPPPCKDAAVIFDCDGVLVDTETCWTRAYIRLFARHGRVFNPHHKHALIGRDLEALGQILAHILDQPNRREHLSTEVHTLALEELAAGAPPMPGAVDLVQELTGRRPVAVASSSPRALVRQLLGKAGIPEFDVVVGGDDVEQPKPAPDVYLHACERLGVPPATGTAVAIEDSPPGAAAAHAAGLYVIGIRHQPSMRLSAHTIAQSLTEFRVRTILGLHA